MLSWRAKRLSSRAKTTFHTCAPSNLFDEKFVSKTVSEPSFFNGLLNRNDNKTRVRK